MSRGCTHTTFYRGKRVLVILHDGTRFVDKFVQSRSGAIEFEGRTVKLKDVRVTTIYREQPVRQSVAP